jgi:glycosyltransferase involved in cell wall biosynthesis
MRICFVSHSSKHGGAERVLLETIEILRSDGIECRVLLPDRGELCAELDCLGVPYSVISYALWMSRGRAPFLRRLRAALNIVIKTTFVAWRIFRWKCDVVYTNTATVCAGAFAARLLGLPHVWHLHEFGLEDQGLAFVFGDSHSLAIINRLSSRCICVSKALARKYARSVPESKIAVIYPSMHRALSGAESEDRVAPASSRGNGRFRCVIVGALMEGKGQEDAVLAVAHLKEIGIDAELKIVGEGIPIYRRHLEALVSSKGLQGRVAFMGQLENALPVIQSSDVVLVCSRSEAFGRVTIEAMRAAKPVIGARSGATAELIRDGVYGLLYRGGDPADLASKIQCLFEDPDISARLGENGKSWVDGYFTPNRYSDELLEVLASLRRRAAAATGLGPSP